MRAPVRVLCLVLAACGSSHATPVDARADVPVDVPLDSQCASQFGSERTAAFGRLDGTVIGVVEPGNMTCALPSSTHVVLEVMMHGAAYRMVVNVLSTWSDPHVCLDEIDAPLAGAPWQEGWHPGTPLDYVTTRPTTC